MNFNQAHHTYMSDLELSLSKIKQLDIAKQRLTFSRWKVSENLDKLLFEFETNVKKTDGKVYWCPDKVNALETLNKHLANSSKVNYLNHIGIKHLLREIDFQPIDNHDNPDTIVMDAKFMIANTGNFFTSFYSYHEYQQFINAKKVIVIAGIDTMLSYQSELPLAKMLYSIFETGSICYPAEILTRPGIQKGLKKEIIFLISDLNKSLLLDHPHQRPLFSLLNFKLPPICPLEQFNYQPNDWKQIDTLQYFLYPFIHDIDVYKNLFFENNGLRHISNFLPYEINLYEHVLNARADIRMNETKKRFSIFNSQSLSNLPLSAKKFHTSLKFEKFAKSYFFGE
jgi:hypothetical protein